MMMAPAAPFSSAPEGIAAREVRRRRAVGNVRSQRVHRFPPWTEPTTPSPSGIAIAAQVHHADATAPSTPICSKTRSTEMLRRRLVRREGSVVTHRGIVAGYATHGSSSPRRATPSPPAAAELVEQRRMRLAAVLHGRRAAVLGVVERRRLVAVGKRRTGVMVVMSDGGAATTTATVRRRGGGAELVRRSSPAVSLRAAKRRRW